MTDVLAALQSDLNTALNEATLVGATVDEPERRAKITLAVLALPEVGPPPEDPRVMLVLAPIGRVCASLRGGRWNDETAPVRPFALSQLMDVVRSFGGQALYGREFIDHGEETWTRLSDRLSLDVRLGAGDGTSHTLDLFQESNRAPEQHLDLRFWFDRMYVFRPAGDALHPVSLEDFAAGGRRWWDGLHRGDPRTAGHDIIPGGPPTGPELRRFLDSINKPRESGPH